MPGSEVLVEFSAVSSILVTRVGVTIVGTIVVGVRVTGVRVDGAAVGLFVTDLGPGSITNTFEAVYGAANSLPSGAKAIVEYSVPKWMLRAQGPPHISAELPVHVYEHPVLAPQFRNTLPQKHSFEFSVPK